MPTRDSQQAWRSTFATFSPPPDSITTTLVVAEGHGWCLERYDRTRVTGVRLVVDER